MRRGEISWASLGEPQVSGPGYRRPVLIVQSNEFNDSAIRTSICAAMTSNMLTLLFQWLRSDAISIPIKATFKLQDIKDAHREYASSAGMGSIIIEVSKQS